MEGGEVQADLLGWPARVLFPCSWEIEVWWLWCWGRNLRHHGCEYGRWLHYQPIGSSEVMPTRFEAFAHLGQKIGGGTPPPPPKRVPPPSFLGGEGCTSIFWGGGENPPPKLWGVWADRVIDENPVSSFCSYRRFPPYPCSLPVELLDVLKPKMCPQGVMPNIAGYHLVVVNEGAEDSALSLTWRSVQEV